MNQRGSALLAVLLFGLALAATSQVLSEVARQAALEHLARKHALCARYAAVSGLSLGPSRIQLATNSGPAESAVSAWYETDGDGRCVLFARGSCGRAVRTLWRLADDPLSCTPDG